MIYQAAGEAFGSNYQADLISERQIESPMESADGKPQPNPPL